MVSPELLSRYPFFQFLTNPQLTAFAALAEEATICKGDDILKTGTPAEALYILLAGRAELHYTIEDPNDALRQREFFITDITPGEIFGISAMLGEPLYNGTVRAASDCRVIKLSAARLNDLAETDCRLGYGLMREIARAALERLHYTRLQLASAEVEGSDTY